MLLDLIRSGQARTRPELGRRSGLGRAAVSRELDRLFSFKLVKEDGPAPSSGGRAPRAVTFRADAGALLVAELGASSAAVGVADLAGSLICSREVEIDIASGPEAVLAKLTELLDTLVDQCGLDKHRTWGMGIGVPGPVEFSTGRSISPPIMPGWNEFPVRGYLAERYEVPVWVDNDVNLLALGELSAGVARGERTALYIKIGTGIGAGIICDGKLHRGAQGCAGDIGHIAMAGEQEVICRCGNFQCLEALAGGFALARDGTKAAESGTSTYLASVLATAGRVSAKDVAQGAQRGDAVCVQLIQRCGHLVGEALAAMVNFFNPSLILIGGGVAGAGDMLLAAIRRAIYHRSLPLATRELNIRLGSLGDDAGLRGAATMVIEELFKTPCLQRWLLRGSPAGLPELTSA